MIAPDVISLTFPSPINLMILLIWFFVCLFACLLYSLPFFGCYYHCLTESINCKTDADK